MSTGKKPDPRRKKFSAPHSTYLKVEPGKSYGGYSAGQYYGCYSHRTHATLPCVANITDDKLTCPYCASGMDAVWRAWVPLWDSDWTLRHVLIGEEIAPSVDSIPHRAKIEVSRHRNPISPTIVREKPGAVNRELPATDPWREPVVMLAVCLVLWKNSDLRKWCEENPKASGLTPPTEAIAIKSDGKPFSPALQGAAKKYGAPVVTPLDADYDKVKNRLLNKANSLKPSTNGDGKHSE